MNQRYEDDPRGYRGGYGMRPWERERTRGDGYDDRMMRGRQQSEAHDAPIVKVIEVLAESELGFEDAANRALYEASRSVRNIRSLWIKDMQCSVRNNRITHYRITAKISFGIEGEEPERERGHGRSYGREWS